MSSATTTGISTFPTGSPNLGYNGSDRACWINSMGGVYQYLDRSEITNSYGALRAPLIQIIIFIFFEMAI